MKKFDECLKVSMGQSFSSVTVHPGERVKVIPRPDSRLTITTVSIVYTDDLPENGRVVLYASKYDRNGDIGQKIAIAPLRVRDCEVVNVDFETASPLIFSTEGAKIDVSISGHTEQPIPLIIEILPPE